MIGKRRHSGNGQQDAAFEMLDGDRARVIGSLHFTTVSALLTAGVAAINAGRAAVIDLAGVTASDSAGLALLIEWLSVAKAAGRTLRFYWYRVSPATKKTWTWRIPFAARAGTF